MKYANRKRDELGYVIIDHNVPGTEIKKIEAYNRQIQKAALARINKSANKGEKPNRRDMHIAYNMYGYGDA